jgi:hypothetical protein
MFLCHLSQSYIVTVYLHGCNMAAVAPSISFSYDNVHEEKARVKSSHLAPFIREQNIFQKLPMEDQAKENQTAMMYLDLY